MESVSTSLDSCGVFAYGGVKDFTVTIVENSNVTTTTTTPTDEYCVAGPTSPSDSNLGRVHLDGVSSSIDNTVDCPGQVGNQYYLDEEADLMVGQSYTLFYDVTTCGGPYTRAGQAWIDWEGNVFFMTYTRPNRSELLVLCTLFDDRTPATVPFCYVFTGLQVMVSSPRVMLLEK